MKIWILNHYAGSVQYGMEFRHYYFAKELIKKGHEVTIFAGSYSHLRKYNPDLKEGIEEEIHEGIKYVWVPTCKYIGNGIERIKSMVQYYFRTVRASKKFEKPDIILSSSPHPAACLAGIKIAKGLKIKNISEVRDLWPEAFVYYKGLSSKSVVVKIMEFFEHKIYRDSDKLVFTKPGDIDYLREKKWLKSAGGDVEDYKCNYVNNGVDLTAFYEQRNKFVYERIRPKRERDDLFVVSYVGTIREVNNIDMLLDAAKELKEYSNVVFRVFGDGEELDRLKKRKKDENIDNVLFYGRIDKRYVPSVLSASNINILNYSPTMYNWSRGNSSNKLFEYMACGKPIISTVKMGYSPIIEYQCGVEIEDCNGIKLANEIEKLIGLAQEQFDSMSKNASDASKLFDYPKLAEKLETIIIDTINGGNKND